MRLFFLSMSMLCMTSSVVFGMKRQRSVLPGRINQPEKRPHIEIAYEEPQIEALLSQWKYVPIDVYNTMHKEELAVSVTYPFLKSTRPFFLPYTMRTINPVRAVYEAQVAEADLAPIIGRPILLDQQLWLWNQTQRLQLCADRVNTNDYIRCLTWRYVQQSILFDGINNLRMAIVAANEPASHGNRGGSIQYKHALFTLFQSPDNTGRVHPVNHRNLQPNIYEKGEIASILLHRDQNRCVRGIKNVYTHVAQNTIAHHYICIDDLARNTHVSVAQLEVDFVLKKAIYLGNTYLGITEDGDMISFWLDTMNGDSLSQLARSKDKRKIKPKMSDTLRYAKQICPGKKFIEIAGDESSRTESGFMRRIGLVDATGDVFITDLKMGQTPILVYTRTLKNPELIDTFFYDKGQCAVAYKIPGKYKIAGKYEELYAWPDMFNIALACASVKNSQNQMALVANK